MEIKQIQSIIKDFEKSNLTSLELEIKDLKIKLSKNNVSDQTTPVKTVQQTVEKEEVVIKTSDAYMVNSPLVGTYYEASNPKDAPFVKVGQRVEKGQTLCIVEAMKIMNEITAPVSGVIESININNGDAVGYDQIIMAIL